MTLKEAYELLDLPEGSDIQLVRARFSEQHSEYRMLIDNAPTPNLRQRYEQNLALREEAFQLINGGSNLDDAADLPNTGPSSYTEPTKTVPKTLTLPEAIELLGLTQNTSPEIVSATYHKYKADLEHGYTIARTESLRQAYAKEIKQLLKVGETIEPWLKSGTAEKVSITHLPKDPIRETTEPTQTAKNKPVADNTLIANQPTHTPSGSIVFAHITTVLGSIIGYGAFFAAFALWVAVTNEAVQRQLQLADFLFIPFNIACYSIWMYLWMAHMAKRLIMAGKTSDYIYKTALVYCCISILVLFVTFLKIELVPLLYIDWNSIFFGSLVLLTTVFLLMLKFLIKPFSQQPEAQIRQYSFWWKALILALVSPKVAAFLIALKLT